MSIILLSASCLAVRLSVLRNCDRPALQRSRHREALPAPSRPSRSDDTTLGKRSHSILPGVLAKRRIFLFFSQFVKRLRGSSHRGLSRSPDVKI